MTAWLFHLTVVAATVALLWLGVNWVDRFRLIRLRHAQTPQALFLELCRAHHLSRVERELLTVISETCTRDKCCMVFVDRQLIAQFGCAQPAHAEECQDLCRRLFGS